MMHALFVVMFLVMPVLTHAVPCIMEAPQQASVEEAPCPSHKPVAAEPCDKTMSVADCLDIDKLVVTDMNSVKLVKHDTLTMAVLPNQPWYVVSVTAHFPQDPPLVRHQAALAEPSLLITTGRFRV